MKRFIFPGLFAVSLLAVLITSCKKEEEVKNTEPDYEKANLTGTVQLFDKAKNEQSPQMMFVTIEGNTFMNYAETDKMGDFTLLNVPFYDNYTLSYIKDGYGTFKIFNFNHQFTGSEGMVGVTPKLGMKSTTEVTYLTVVSDTLRQDTAIRFKIGVSKTNVSNSNPAYVRFLFHEINLVNDTSYSNYSPRIPIASNPADIVFTKADFQEMGMQTGSSYFVRAYGESYYTNEYFDFVKLKEVFPNLYIVNSPSAIEIIAP